MKQHVLSIGMATALTCVTASAQSSSSMTIYGITDAAFVRVDNNAGKSSTTLDSGRLQGSRLGFRGREDLGGGLAAIFALEHGLALDTGMPASATVFWNRQSWLGLSSQQFGNLTMGYQYTPMYDQLIGLTPAVTFGGHGGTVDGVALPSSPAGRFDNTLGGTRIANSVKYHSPRFAGFRGLAMLGFGEVAGSSKAGRTVSFGLGYDDGPLSGGLFYLGSECRTATGCAASAAKNKVLAAGLGYDFGVARMSVVVSDQKNARNARDVDGTAYSILGTVPVGALSLSAGISGLNDKSDKNWDVRQFNLGVQYALSRRTTLYGFWSRQTVANGGKAHMLLVDSSDSQQAQYGLGVRHTF